MAISCLHRASIHAYARARTAGLLVDVDGLTCPRPALDACELARPVVAVGLGGRQAQHAQVVGLGLHPPGHGAAREDLVHARQTGNFCKWALPGHLTGLQFGPQLTFDEH